jgi:hypothetical protein
MRTARLVSTLALAALLAQSAGAQAEFALTDVDSFAGQNILHFRDVVLRDEPARAIQSEHSFEEGTRYGLLPVGDVPEGGLLLVWLPRADPPLLWIDADGDERLKPDERFLVKGDRLEVPIRAAFEYEQGVQREPRTVILRRSALGGWQYAARGYRQGRLVVGPREHAAILIDGNANGRFDDAGEDRIWIDQDDDGRFDPFLERFPLGRTMRVGDEVYAIRADRGGAQVRAQPRSKDRGVLRLALGVEGAKVRSFGASLVSDIGELVRLEALDEPHSLPVGAYRFASLQLELEKADENCWRYTFSGLREYAIDIVKDGVTRLSLPGDLRFEMTVQKRPSRSMLYDEMNVTPRITSALGVYLTNCSVGRSARRIRWRSHEATIAVLSDAGGAFFDVRSGFA